MQNINERHIKRKSGISLIVLVITIIVMIILAAAVILSLSSSGIIDRANEAVTETNLKQVETLAQTIWSEIYIENMEGKNFDYATEVPKRLEEQGIDTTKYIIDANGSGVTVKSKSNDKTAPVLTITTPESSDQANPTQVDSSSFTVTGKVEDESAIRSLTVNGTETSVNEDGTWSHTITLNANETTTITVVAIDEKNNTTTVARYVCYFKAEPASCGIDGHYTNDGKTHGELASCSNGHTYTCECTGWVVPDGGTYYVGVTSTALGNYTGATATYTAGDVLPCGYVSKAKDVYVNEDYEYRYDRVYYSSAWRTLSVAQSDYYIYGCTTGWGIFVLDKTQSDYGEIMESVNGANVTNLVSTFEGCTALTTAPAIPSGVTTMHHAFNVCTALTDASNVIVSQNVTHMTQSFYKCTLLTVPPDMSRATGVVHMNNTFNYCSALATAPDLSNCSNLTSLVETFSGCTALTAAPDLSNCTNLISMSKTFSGCTSLTTATVIPSSVTDMFYTFNYCTSLTGSITIHATPSSYTDCLYKTGITEILGDCGNKSVLLSTKS